MQIAAPGPDYKFIFALVTFIVSLLSGLYAVEQRIRKWTEDGYLTKETANTKFDTKAEELASICRDVDEVRRDCMQNTLAIEQNKVLAQQLNSLSQLEREHHEFNVSSSKQFKAEIIQSIESKFGSILEELRRLRNR